jgi:hypothetical protein
LVEITLTEVMLTTVGMPKKAGMSTTAGAPETLETTVAESMSTEKLWQQQQIL